MKVNKVYYNYISIPPELWKTEHEQKPTWSFFLYTFNIGQLVQLLFHKAPEVAKSISIKTEWNTDDGQRLLL